MKFATEHVPVKIIMLGAGGTGAHIAPNLYRLLFALIASERPRKVRFIIADGDAVEEKNLIRQHFSAAELGMNKARAIAQRYSDAFGMRPEYIPDFIESRERLTKLVMPERVSLRKAFKDKRDQWVHELPQQVILIGAVDNNKSRKLCHEVFMAARDLIYIDSGNGEFSGQVVCGVRKNGRTVQKPVGSVFPDVLEDTDKFPTQLSCAEASVSAPQAITANLTAAMVVVNFIYNILILGECRQHSATFSTKSISVRPEMAEKRRRAA